MSESAGEAIEPVWTNSNLLKLLTCLSQTIPEEFDTINYQSGMKSVNWNKVAFGPFSPEECRQKWTDIMEKMRKLRSLPDLVTEAKNTLSDPLLYRNIHPEVPKRPIGPRKFYFKEHYQKFKEKHPNMKTQKIFKLLYKKFDKLPEEKRTEYEKKYTGEVLEYHKKMQEFGKQNKIPVKVTLAPRYKRYEKEFLDLPAKPPRNSYALFCAEFWKASEGKSKLNALDLSCNWKRLSLTEKAAYKKRWIELQKQYALDLRTYLDGFSKEEQIQLIKEKGIRVPKVQKLTPKLRKPCEPKMPSQDPYSHFMDEQLKLLDKTQSLRERRIEAQERWKDLPTKEKKRYKTKVHEETKRYAPELQKWFKTLEPEEQSKFLKNNPSKSEFLDVNKMTNGDQIKQKFGQTSDSEDEAIVNISDEEDDMSIGSEDDEEEEDIIMFEID